MKVKLFLSAIGILACNDSQARTATVANSASVNGTSSLDHSTGATQGHRIQLQTLPGSLKNPVYVTSPPGDARLFVVEQAGVIRVYKNDVLLPQPFLDITSRVKSGGEQGLLSMAFHPEYSRNGFFFVNFTDLKGDTHVERFKVGAAADVADPNSASLVIKIEQPYGNHNGGHILFGHDGMLYVGMGDGGAGGDPKGNGQKTSSLLGKMLRLNVSRTEPYSIPMGNPYANGKGGRPEIWAIGLRNPWRFAFDREAKLLYIADVGQNEIEEVHVESSSSAGLNYGWSRMEGDRCYRGSCDKDGLRLPQLVYNHAGGACSITGGFVYRGKKIPAIAGHYFYSDYCAGWLRSFKFENGNATDKRSWDIEKIGHIVSFGEDSAGELYIVAEGGKVYRIAGVR